MPENIEKRREYMKNWKHEWRQKHPDREHAARIRDAINLLRKNGYGITEPTTISN